MRASPQGWLRDKASLCAYVCKLGLGLRAVFLSEEVKAARASLS